jgi:hypothetical protein
MADSDAPGSPSVGQYLKYAPLLTVTLVGLFAQFNYLPNHDTSWLLEVARRLAAGATLYSADIVEINPPLIIHLAAPGRRPDRPVAVALGALAARHPRRQGRRLTVPTPGAACLGLRLPARL